jgi:hypothetical protein
MTASITKTSSPAIEQLQRLSIAFDLFNAELFDGALPPVMLQLRNKPGSAGSFCPKKWTNAQGVLIDVINLDSQTAATRPLHELLSTLAHEMAHAYVFSCVNDRKATGGHGPDWRRKMLDLGLPPIQVGSTWRQATHSIDPDGAYMQAFNRHRQQLQELPWQECIGHANRGRGLDRVKFQCPVCSSNAWARGAALLLCGQCSNKQRLVEMLPEHRPTGGGGKGSHKRAEAKREHYPEPTGVPALPVWTDELSRELRLHTGLDHPPTTVIEALMVLTFGVRERGHGVLMDALAAAVQQQSAEAVQRALKPMYRHRCQLLHPDMEGGSEVSFKALQTAYLMVKRAIPTAADVAAADATEQEDQTNA